MCTNKRKIVLVGTGMVGMSFAYSALNRALCDELVLVDIDKKRAQGEAMDLNHGIAFASARMLGSASPGFSVPAMIWFFNCVLICS